MHFVLKWLHLDLPDFDRTNTTTLKAKSGSVVTQLQYARQGIITPEMEFIAIRENMKLQESRGALEVNSDHDRNDLAHQHVGESKDRLN